MSPFLPERFRKRSQPCRCSNQAMPAKDRVGHCRDCAHSVRRLGRSRTLAGSDRAQLKQARQPRSIRVCHGLRLFRFASVALALCIGVSLIASSAALHGSLSRYDSEVRSVALARSFDVERDVPGPSPCAHRTAVMRDGTRLRAGTGALFRAGSDAPLANSPDYSVQSQCRPTASHACTACAQRVPRGCSRICLRLSHKPRDTARTRYS
jgi:hypothetical protein